MKNIQTIDEYIKSCPKDYQERLSDLRELIVSEIPNVEQKISWGMPTFYDRENIIHFALAKHHIGIYPGSEAIVEFKDKLVKYKTSKGAIQIPLDTKIPNDLIKEIIRYRIKMIHQ